jgi:dynein heavy chain
MTEDERNKPMVDRLKIIALVTIEVHARDIIEGLMKSCFSPVEFEWLK